VVGPYGTQAASRKSARRAVPSATLERRSPAARLAEAHGLAEAIALDVAASQIVPVAQIHPATYLGKGKVDELAAFTAAQNIALVFLDCTLTPVQQRNLEKAWGCKAGQPMVAANACRVW